MTSSELGSTCKDLRSKEDPTASWVTCKWNWQVPRSFLTVKSGHWACRFQWRVGPSYCEYSGVTYDLLVNNIGGTYDLADQLPGNREFGNYLVVSHSQVPREFDVNLALGIDSPFVENTHLRKREYVATKPKRSSITRNAKNGKKIISFMSDNKKLDPGKSYESSNGHYAYLSFILCIFIHDRSCGKTRPHRVFKNPWKTSMRAFTVVVDVHPPPARERQIPKAIKVAFFSKHSNFCPWKKGFIPHVLPIQLLSAIRQRKKGSTYH